MPDTNRIDPNDPNTLNVSVRHKCAKCDRLAATYGKDGEPLCARHGTFFVTRKMAEPND